MINRSYRQIVIQTIFVLIVLSAARLGFLVSHLAEFSGVSGMEIFLSVLHGVRFDLVVVCKTFGFLFLIQALLGKWYYHPVIHRILTVLSYLLLFIILFTIGVDIHLFDLRGKHLSFEIFMFKNDVQGVLTEALVENWLYILLSLAVIFIILAFWHKTVLSVTRKQLRRFSWKRHFIVFPVFLVLLVIGIRGGTQKSPVIEKLAFRNENMMLGHLTLSGPYTLIRAFEQDRSERLNIINPKLAITTTRKLLFTSNETALDPDYPLLRKTSYPDRPTGRAVNVVFIFLESWPAIYVGALNPTYRDLTPNFDRIADQSLLFTRFWGNGLFSNDGFAATMASVPTFPNLSILDSSFFGTTTQSIPRMLIDQGYDSLFIMGYPEGSSYIDYFFKTAGIKHQLCRKDFPATDEYRDLWGIWDEKLYDRFLKETAKLKEPFLSILFTSTTHTPHTVPGDEWKVYDSKTDKADFKNSLRYADWALGQYFDRVRQTKYYANTVFFILGDHVSNTGGASKADAGRIPFLIHSPGGLISPGKDSINGMQVDILPTLIDLLKWNVRHASTGKSVFAKSRGADVAVHTHGNMFYWIKGDDLAYFFNTDLKGVYNLSNDWQTRHNLQKSVDSRETEIEFKSYYQLIQNLIFDNRIYK